MKSTMADDLGQLLKKLREMDGPIGRLMEIGRSLSDVDLAKEQKAAVGELLQRQFEVMELILGQRENLPTEKDTPITVGDVVVLSEVPPELISGLPDEDVAAIAAQIGSKMKVSGFDELGNVELEFASSADTFHTIFVTAKSLRKVD
ncbi:hypothetical protein [Hyphomicrobium sp. D-2]|uniref:hypothetical protein n=1 Tax=Hyphomicrobium sp. D-2 TaxID=3041621 RepID=UPI002454878D|nr:hypothetical protein [Hyphomicrobium sp. D-2]MDH4982593.1 hypothetical protein [Hyphomicrobium sp. D-2]